MVNETREVLETSEVKQLLSTCVNIGVNCILDKLSEIVTALSIDVKQPSDDTSFLHPSNVDVYVAKLVPALNNLIFQDFWPVQLLAVEPLRIFGANIYESFSTL